MKRVFFGAAVALIVGAWVWVTSLRLTYPYATDTQLAMGHPVQITATAIMALAGWGCLIQGIREE